MAASSATYAFSRRPLSRAYRPFMGTIFKARSGSRAVIAERISIVSEGGVRPLTERQEQAGKRAYTLGHADAIVRACRAFVPVLP